MWRYWNSSILLVGMQNAVAAMENRMDGPQNIKIELPYHLATPLLNIYPKELNSGVQEGIRFPCSLQK